MNTGTKTRSVALALVLLSLASPALAWKGRTTRVVFTCMGSARPFEVTNADALSFQYGPWGGGFIDLTKGAVAAAPARRVCQVDFYAWLSPLKERLAYVLYYYPASDGKPGYIYLPARGQPWYGMNVGTIIRPGVDGTWHVASERWEQSVARPALAAAG